MKNAPLCLNMPAGRNVIVGKMEINQKLNPEQWEAVNTFDGPLLVLAGAGSGKTRVVTFRIVNLIKHGISPGKILGLTFTNKAAGEMRERIQALTQSHVLICTFHSLGARLLRESIHHLGYQTDFTIYDENDTEKLIKTCLADLGFSGSKVEAKSFQSLISKAKNALLDPSKIDDSSYTAEGKFFPELYRCYQEKLKEYNALDFDDLLYLPVRLFREFPEVLHHYQERWSHLLIDEYQDTNVAQYTLVRCLVEKSQNLCVVGDPDQSIYSWRGANVENILNFEHDYPNAKVVRLEQNYRSRINILEAANALISHNERRFEKKLWSDLGPGEPIKRFIADTDRDEAEFVAEQIRYHHDHHQVPLTQMVVFYRTNAQSRLLEDRLFARGIPYVIVGGISFYQRKEVKDILAFLRMVQSGADFVSFARTINIPKRGIGEATLEKIRLAATKENRTVLSYCESLVHERPLENAIRLPPKQKDALKNYVETIQTLKEVNKSCDLTELVKQTIEQTSYLNYLAEDKETFEDRKGNLDALVAKAIEWEVNTQNPTLASFLEELALKSSLDEASHERDQVNLMTIHNGKGLEFTVTFIVGMEEDLFPHANSREDHLAQEEERRLCYVGMTRAKEYLYLCETRQRFLWGTQRSQRSSRFLREIPNEFILKITRTHSPNYYYKKSRVPEFLDPPHEEEPPEPIEILELKPGDTIFHQDFGIGVVEKIFEGSVGLSYKILFSKDQRLRTLVAAYAKLKLL